MTPAAFPSTTVSAGPAPAFVASTASARNEKNDAPQYSERFQAHIDFLNDRQRKSGVRLRLCTTGCYSIYNANGQYMARTAPPGALLGVGPAALKAAAVNMAMSDDMLAALRLVDGDTEKYGAVTVSTVTHIRDLLAVLEAA